MRRGDAVPLLIAGASFVLFAFLIHKFPVMYWDDPYARLENRHHLFVGRWLPLLQILLDGIAKLTPSITAMRIVLAGIGALTVLAGYRLAARLFEAWTAALFAILLATSPLFVALSIVPYQEVLFAGLIFAGLALHFGPRGSNRLSTAVLFNLACLTRYEGWVAVGLLALFEARGARPASRALKVVLTVAARYGWTAVAWILILAFSGNLGRLSAGHSSAHPTLGAWGRSYFGQLREQVGHDILIVLAVAGVAFALARRKREPHAFLLSLLLACLTVTFVVDPYSVGNLRQAFLPLVFVLFYAAFGLTFTLERITDRIGVPHRRGILSVATVVAAAGVAFEFVPRAMRFVEAAANERDARVTFEVAQRINAARADGGGGLPVVMLSANGLHAAVLATYTGIPRDRIVTSLAGHLPSGARYVVDIRLPTATPSADSAAWRGRLESGALPATSARLDSAVVWTLEEPVGK